MPRAWFGGGAADFVYTPTSGRFIRTAAATLTFWTAKTGGTQHTDLLLDGSPVSSITVGPDGQVPEFQGPDGVGTMWVDAGGGRVQLDAALSSEDIAAAQGAADVLAELETGRLSEAGLSATYAAKGEAGGGLQPRRRPAPALYGAKRLLIPATGHGWALRTDDAATGSTTTEDTTRPGPFSDRSIKLTRGASGYAQALSPALTGLDLSAGPLTVWVYLPNANPKGIQIAALDESWANGYQWERYGVTDIVDGWAVFELYITDTDVATLGTGGATVATRLRVRTSWSNDQAWLGAIIQKPSPTTVYPNGVATFYFDDGAASVHDLAYPVLSKYGAQAVIATICDQIGTPGLMTLEELRELQDRGGWEIGFHAHTIAAHNARFDTLSAAALEAEFRNGKKWLQDNGFDSDAWISPGGVNNSTIFQTARRYFSTVRSVAGPGNSGVRQGGVWTAPRPMFPANIPSPSFDTTSATVANMKATLDKVKASKSWGHLTFHSVSTSASSGGTISTADLDTIVAYANTIGVPIRTVRGVLQDVNGV